MSSAPLTGYDNTDRQSGQADAEVFLYRVGAGLSCVSCKRSGARPAGAQLLDGSTHTPGTWAAAAIPTWETQLYQPRALAENGRRLFFESFDPLVPTDTNGAQDVYEWEAPGEGGCEEASAAFDPKAGGCIALVSSGQSPAPSSFVDASADGADVFLTTAQSLVPWDPGQIDVYDARIGGGLPGPAASAEGCQGEACQGSAAAPAARTPASATYTGPGNVKAKARRCPKGKRRVRRHGRTRCLSRRHRHRSHGRHRHRHRKQNRRRAAE